MKERLTQLLELLKQANPATRIALVVSTLVLVAVAGVSSWYANRPDFVELWSGLSSAEAASYKNALAEAGIPFRSSPPPENGIWVDSSQRTEAEAAVALGGTSPVSRGIPTQEGGATSAFLSANTRRQMQAKRDWQECELMLETLDFVNSATVVGSGHDGNPFLRGGPQTVSVTLDLRHGSTLTTAQARNVARLVRTRFDVPMENITIMDRRGDLLHDGSPDSDAVSGEDLFERQRRFDDLLERKANQLLEHALGPGMAQVTVHTEWSFEETESIQQAVTPGEVVVVEERTSESKKPVPDRSTGGPVGVSANITQDFGTGHAGVPASTGGEAGEATTLDKEKHSKVGTRTEHRRSRTPQLERLSVALVVDASVAADLDGLASMVKSAVGYDESRNDQFQSFVGALAALERDEAGNPILPEKPEPAEPPNELLMLALEHGVEILAALAFVFILIKSLRGARGAGSGGRKVVATAQAAIEAEAVEAQVSNPALLARVQVEELVRTDPERVSEILAQWARGEVQHVRASR